MEVSVEVRYLLSFLAILVDRAGGQLEIEHLSKYASTDLRLEMKLDIPADKVILKTKKEVMDGRAN